jgi:hypothetical protein
MLNTSLAMPRLEPSRTNTITQVTRRRGPPDEEWDRVKPLIKRYYIVEKRKLKDVRLLLLDEHEFDAASVSDLASHGGFLTSCQHTYDQD